MAGRVITEAEAVRAARRMYAARCTVDMDELAAAVGVSRATLYRVVASRDRLLGRVLWSYAGPLYDEARRATTSRGTDRLLEVLRRFGTSIMANAQFRTFIASEPQVAMRVLFTPAGGVHEAFVEANKQLLADTAAAGEVTPPFDLDSLAYVFSRIFESMWYADLLSGRDVDLDLAEHAARAVLVFDADGPARR
jgi:AcrR family transcriptional regulator